jgi:acetyl/propionyl-CoA carboxylase alpha subunit
MAKAATVAARAVGYRNAGTVEFLVQGDSFYFLEVNARLQVEHPETEVVTGLDLVAEQFRIARGEPASRTVRPIVPSGHGLECRISAEDPHEGFLPVTGVIEDVREAAGPWVRVDSSLAAGMQVTHHYDPLLAKVIAWGPSREEAIARMRRALEEMAIAGLPTTLPFHHWALGDTEFLQGRHNTQFTVRWERRSPRKDREPLAALVAAAVVHQLTHRMVFPPPSLDSAWGRAAREEGLR